MRRPCQKHHAAPQKRVGWRRSRKARSSETGHRGLRLHPFVRVKCGFSGGPLCKRTALLEPKLRARQPKEHSSCIFGRFSIQGDAAPYLAMIFYGLMAFKGCTGAPDRG